MNQPILSNGLITLFLLIALAGFTDAAYLTYAHYTHTILPCSLTQGCEVVTTSIYATIGIIPIALIGALYYLLLAVSAVAYLDTKKTYVMRYGSYLTFGGFATSCVLIGLQVFVLDALCLYCIFSATSSTALFILGVIILQKTKRNITPIYNA